MESENNQKTKNKKIAKKVGSILFYACLSVIFVFAAFSLTSRFTGGRIGDSQFLVVVSSSMDGEPQEEYEIKKIPVKSLIKVDLIKDGEEKTFYSSLKKGDVLTFNYLALNNVTITHRIIEEPTLLSDGETYQIKLRGDAVEGEGNIQTVYSDGRTGEVIGKVSFVSLPLGRIYFFMSSKVGMLVLIVLPCSAVCIFEITKIIYVVSESKRKDKEKANQEIQNQKDKEIEELKAKLESLQQKEKEGE